MGDETGSCGQSSQGKGSRLSNLIQHSVPDSKRGIQSGQDGAQDPGLQKTEPQAGGCALSGALFRDLGLKGLDRLVEQESLAVGGEAQVGRGQGLHTGRSA